MNAFYLVKKLEKAVYVIVCTREHGQVCLLITEIEVLKVRAHNFNYSWAAKI
eukprot:c21709_g1_i2 orf=455-610(+)